MNGVSIGVGIVVALLTTAGLLGAAWPYFRGKQAEAYTELLEKALAAERTERGVEQAQCNEKIAELRGRMGALTDGFAGIVATAVVDVVERKLKEMTR